MTDTTANTNASAPAKRVKDYLENLTLSVRDRQLGAAVMSVQAVIIAEQNVHDFLAPWFLKYSVAQTERDTGLPRSAHGKLLTPEQEDFMHSIQDAWREISKLKRTCGFKVDTPTGTAVNGVIPEQRNVQVNFLNDARDTIRDHLINILTISGHIINDEQFDRAAIPRFRELGAPQPV